MKNILQLPLIIIPVLICVLITPARVNALTFTLPITEDTYVDSGYPDTNRSLASELIIGLVKEPCQGTSAWSSAPSYCNNYKAHTYVKPPIQTLREYNIQPDEIQFAELFLFKYDQSTIDSTYISTYSVPSPWEVSSLTWSTKPLMGSLIRQGHFTSSLGWQSVNITQWVKQELAQSYNQSYLSNGLVLRTYDSNALSSRYYSSRCLTSDSIIPCNVGETPYVKLEVNFPVIPDIQLIQPQESLTIYPDEIVTFEIQQKDEKNQLSYYLEISRNPDFNDSYRSLSQKDIVWSTPFEDIGTYWWRIHSFYPFDPLNNNKISEARTITVIETPPNKEPPQTDNEETAPEEEHIESPILSPNNTLSSNPSAAYPESQTIQQSFAPHQSTSKSLEVQGIQTSNDETNSLPIQSVPKSQSEEQKSKSLVSKAFCEIHYFRNNKTWKTKNCTIPAPTVQSAESFGAVSALLYSTTVNGTQPTTISIHRLTYDCEKKSIFKPRSWFICIPIMVEEETATKTLTTIIVPQINNSKQIQLSVKKHTNTAEKFTTKILSTENLAKKSIQLSTHNHFAINIDGKWIDHFIYSPKSKAITITTSADAPSVKPPFRYPFSTLVGVTQWHGNTAFQKPHTGIDFGATSLPIIASQSGIIVSAGYDTYYGTCKSGGYYVVIQHPDGKHSAYFHLKNITRNDGSIWKTNDPVSAGQVIATSGNSGAWNCQKLAYHLHYEIRSQRQQSTHINPVPLTDIDWSLIPTLNWQSYPGRLTGDNPHPTF